MTPFGAVKSRAQSVGKLPSDLQKDLPKRGLVFLVGNQYTTGRRVVVDLDRNSMQFQQRSSDPIDGPKKSAGVKKLSEPQLEQLIVRANVFWSTDPIFKEPRRSTPDQGVTLILVDSGQSKLFDSHDTTDELHVIYEMLWSWLTSPVTRSQKSEIP